ncbi:hypothetical protein HOY80DRAFT_1140618 [Tuber brumale]|nr:hypothetical protein HOY80DRAFT_1140618 [Tuber brumale]
MYIGLGERSLFGPKSTNPADSNAGELVGACITLITLTLLAITLRVYSRAYLIRNMGADDWTMVFAAISELGIAVPNLVGAAYFGTGKHMSNVPKSWNVPARQLGYVAQIFYFACLGFCKASVVLFVIRLTTSRTTARVAWGLLAFSSCFSLAAVLVSIFSCVPVEYIWKSLTPEGKNMKAVCLDQRALQYTLPAINIFTDFFVWLLPLKMIWHVQLPRRQKNGLIGIFALGALGVLAGIFRLFSIKKFVASHDRSFDGVDISIWSIVEATISIVCGSAPAIKPFFSKFLPNVLGVSSNKSYTHPTSETFGSSGNPKPTKPRSHPASYALGTLNPVTHREESSSTEQLGFGTCTEIEGQMASRSVSGSEECLNENAVSGGHGGIGEGVKVTTDVQVHVEERV